MSFRLAIRYLREAAHTSRARHAQREACESLQRALDLLARQHEATERDAQELALRVEIGPLLIALTGYSSEQVKVCYERAATLCSAIDSSVEQFPVVRGLAMFHIMRANYTTAVTLAQQMLALARGARAPQPGLALQGHLMLAISDYLRGEFAAALEHAEQCLSLFDRDRDHGHALAIGYDSQMMGVCFEALSLWHQGQFDRALAKSREALRLGESLSHPFSFAQCLIIVAEVHQLLRQPTKTLALADSALTLAEEHGFPDVIAAASCHRGWALAMQGNASAGIECIRAGIAGYQHTGVLATRTSLLAVLGEAYALDRRTADGLCVVDEALALVEETGERFYLSELLRIKGMLLRQRDKAETVRAESCLREALAHAEQQGSLGFALRAAIELAKLWTAQGHDTKSRKLLERIAAGFDTGLKAPELDAARELIDTPELSTPARYGRNAMR